jgi:cytochrome c oxidase subunit 2
VRRGSLVQLVLFGLVAAAIATAVALAIPWLPDWAGKEAQRIGFVFWFTTAIAIAIFSLVAAIIVYSIWKFRAPPEDDADGPPIHGHTGLEIVWTAVPAVLVTAISIVSAVVLAQNSHAGRNPLVVQVSGQQFAWSFKYPNGQSFPQLRLPLGRHTELQITSKDVIHSFWVPQLAQKQDAVPGQYNKLIVTPTRTGTFDVICTELCGLGHAIMRSQAIIMPTAAFDTWLKHPNAGQTGPPGLTAFNQNGCGACHTLKAAGSTAAIGPDLDKLPQYAQQAKQPLAAFVRQSIVDPGAYVQPGYQDIMPHTFKQQIPAPQLDQLVQYLVKESGGK